MLVPTAGGPVHAHDDRRLLGGSLSVGDRRAHAPLLGGLGVGDGDAMAGADYGGRTWPGQSGMSPKKRDDYDGLASEGVWVASGWWAGRGSRSCGASISVSLLWVVRVGWVG